jgi:hypothetical protein
VTGGGALGGRSQPTLRRSMHHLKTLAKLGRTTVMGTKIESRLYREAVFAGRTARFPPGPLPPTRSQNAPAATAAALDAFMFSYRDR